LHFRNVHGVYVKRQFSVATLCLLTDLQSNDQRDALAVFGFCSAVG
jgi:hypothetical protein